MDAVVTLGADEFSEDILHAVAALQVQDAVSAPELAAALFRVNPRLSRGREVALAAQPGAGVLAAEIWPRHVRRLLLAHGRLDGTLLAIGLTLLDEGLGRQLVAANLLELLKADAHHRWAGHFARLRHFAHDFDAEAIRFVRGAANGATRALALDSVLVAGSLAATEPALADLVHPSEEVYLHSRPHVEDPEDVLVSRELAAAFQRARRSGPIGVVSLLNALFDPSIPAADQPLVQRVLELRGVDRRQAWTRVREFLSDRPDAGLELPGARAVRLAGYDSDIAVGVEDRLGVERDVVALSALVAAQETSPPLSIGLFGDWGSGKSFFMDRMRARVAEFAGRRDFCRRIVQIEFNAWHFLDANLWASLVTHIFDRLFAEIDPETVGDKLKAAHGLFSAAQEDYERARGEVAAAEQGLTQAQQRREQTERSFSALADNLRMILAGRPEVTDALRQSAEKIGISKAIASYDELTRCVGQVHTLTGRVTAIAHTIVADPMRRTNVPLLIAILAVPFGVAALIEFANQGFWSQVNAVTKAIGGVTTVLVGTVAWLSKQAQTGAAWIDKVEDAYAAVSQVREERLAATRQQHQGALELAVEHEAAARKRLEEATLHLRRIEQEQNPGVRLRRFIEQRTTSSDYSKHLSIVTLIRKDFEELSRLMEGRDAALPIDRIVLYIDDLDRCRPQRVIEVLEAVHLLLAFPLFVVVVAVDPRWLNRCLELHYPQLLGGRGGGMDASSPQDYLEKIFQIPFMVRPIDTDGYRQLVKSLVPVARAAAAEAGPGTVAPQPNTGTEPRVAGEPAVASEPAVAGDAAIAGEPTVGAAVAAEIARSLAEDPPAGADAAAAKEALVDAAVEALAVEPRQLELKPWERDAIEALAPLFTTPRSVKRFVNIYRLMRVSLQQSELAAFEGTADKPGDHRAVLLLLALVTNYPRVASHFLDQVGSALDVMTWSDLLARLSEGAGVLPDGLVDDEARDWKVMCRRLSGLSPEHLPGALITSRTWSARVVRYSFFVASRTR